MNITSKVIEIYRKYYICPHCLGRCFALLGTATTNLDRGYSLLLSITMENHDLYLSRDKDNENVAIDNLRILAENANFLPSQKVLENEGIEYNLIKVMKKCYLCNDLFLNLQPHVDKAKESVINREFESILVGSRPDSSILNREDIFKAEFNLLNSESFKGHFNRAVGKKISSELNVPAVFKYPDLTFLFSLSFENFSVEINIRSIFIAGRYNKLIRGIPQTRWICKTCQGKGCDLCNNSGKMYKTSVEELISPEFIYRSIASGSKFHGAGREDIDVRMLGNGRPFILELENPMIRSLELNKILKRVNKKNSRKVKIFDLRYSNKKEVINIKTKSEISKKTYKVLVEASKNLSFNKFRFNQKISDLKSQLENQKISQRTPNRVSHRRADKIREKTIYEIEGRFLKPQLFEFIIKTQGGTYIKELIHGDNGRTIPSFSEIFNNPLSVLELDVIGTEE